MSKRWFTNSYLNGCIAVRLILWPSRFYEMLSFLCLTCLVLVVRADYTLPTNRNDTGPQSTHRNGTGSQFIFQTYTSADSFLNNDTDSGGGYVDFDSQLSSQATVSANHATNTTAYVAQAGLREALATLSSKVDDHSA